MFQIADATATGWCCVRTRGGDRRAVTINDSSRDSARQRLIMATIDCIEELGLGKTTVRAIAKCANVNIAAVSYYFGSKEELVGATLEHTLDHMLADVREYLERVPEQPRTALSELLSYLLEGSLRYPRLTQAHLHDAFVNGDYSGGFPSRFALIQRDLERALRSVLPDCSADQRRRAAARALSAVLLPAFFGGLFAPSAAFSSASKRQHYASETAAALLATVPRSGR
jgi:AcrR family transcriptional regulator